MQYFVKLLSAAVKVVRRDAEGTLKMRHVGFDQAGKALLEPATKVVTVEKGQPLPDDVADGEVDRLLSLDPPAIGQKAAVSVMKSPAEAKSKKSTSKKSASSTARKPATAAKASVDLDKLNDLDDAALATAIAAVGAKKLVTAIGNDAALAQRVLDAEKTAATGDPRKSLVDPLEKVIAAGSAS